MNVKKTQFYHLFFSLFVDDLFVKGFFLRMLNNVLQPENFLSIEVDVLDIFVDETFDNELRSLIPFILDEIINYQLVQVE